MSDFEKQFRELQATARGESTTAGAIRQSVTDEAVQRAIDYFTARKFTIETYLADHDKRESESINTALTALRQMKPTDEAVRVAIDWQEAEKASAQKYWERAGAEWRMEPGAQEQHDERMASFDLAIQALQAYEPTTRKNRIVEEAVISKTETTSCEWCDGGIDTASLMDADMMMRFVRPVNYCPNCGRKSEG